jgi:hypothetical protein
VQIDNQGEDRFGQTETDDRIGVAAGSPLKAAAVVVGLGGKDGPQPAANALSGTPKIGVVFLRAASGTCRSLRGEGSGDAIGGRTIRKISLDTSTAMPIKGEDIMRLQSSAVLAGLAWTIATTAAMAHHSFAMFDTEHPIEISGVVKEFRFVNPHAMLVVKVKGEDGVDRDWVLEGGAPGLLIRDGLTANALKPGDEIMATINPLHGGAEGGAFQPPRVKFKDGRPLVTPR